MYQAYFGLTERPFSIAPDPQYLYMSSRHKEAMAHLSYGLSQGGCFIVLTGEVGTGKTTLCRNLLAELPDSVDVALILNANINELELLQTICDELKISYTLSNTQKQLLDLINQYLLTAFAKNRRTVLIIDEAQLLSRDVLEQIRLLTNLETTKAKLLQIILIGQPELNQLLSRDDLRQLAQRVTARYHLGALQQSEIEDYVNYRLGVAGCKQPLFSRQALNKMHAMTDGIPRKINVLADHALLAAYAKTESLVDSAMVKKAANDVFITTSSSKDVSSALPSITNWLAKWWLPICALVLINIGLWWFFTQSPQAVGVLNPSLHEVPEKLVDPVANPTAGKVVFTDTILDDSVDPSLSVEQFLPDSKKTDEDNSGSIDDQKFLANSESTASTSGGNGLSDRNEPSANIEPSANKGPGANDKALTVNGQKENPLLLMSDDSQFGRVLETSADVTGRIAAFRNLAKIWKIEMPEQLIIPACQAVSQQGLRCLGFSQWAQLQRFNRPTIIVLSHQDQLHRVIVQSIDNDKAQVLVGSNVHTVTLAELRSRWINNALLFWRPSEAGTELYQYGDQNNRIVALRDYLNRALNEAELPLLTSISSEHFDIDMSQKVFVLQTRYEIARDSRIGNETYLLMNELVQSSTIPILTKRVEEK